MNVPKSLIGRLRGGKAGFVERLTTDQRSVALYTAEEVFALGRSRQRGAARLGSHGAVARRCRTWCACASRARSKKRVEWLMGELETDDAEFAEAEIRRSDDAHASRMHDRFGVTWGDPVLYDLVLNTDRVSVESCVEQIAGLTRRPEFAETPQSRALLADMTLAGTRAGRAEGRTPRRATSDITVEASQGRVTLRGIVLNAEERAQTESVATAVPGVTGVDNELQA